MKSNLTKKLILAAFIMLISIPSIASEFSAGADLYSRYIWRGRDYGNSPSIQPGLEYSNGGFAIGAWGAFSIDTDVYQELDLYVSYSIMDMFSIGITDYFFPAYNSADATTKTKYFQYEDDKTGHILEANIGFAGLESLPISLSANIAFYGDDKNADGDPNFSTYIEAAYSGNLKNVSYSAFIGITPSEGLYGNDFGVVNLGLTATKELKFSESFSLPVTSGLIFNPQDENAFLIIGITL